MKNPLTNGVFQKNEITIGDGRGKINGKQLIRKNYEHKHTIEN